MQNTEGNHIGVVEIGGCGLVAGLAATVATNRYQAAAGPLLGQGGSGGDPANLQAADSASRLALGRPVERPHRELAGNAVHYATGMAIGLGNVAIVTRKPAAAAGFGVPFGLGIAAVLDELIVPALGWGPWPWRTPATTHVHGASTHMVFGAVLEGGRRLTLATLDRIS